MLVCVVAYIGVLAPSDARDRIIANDGGSGRTDIWKIGWRMVEDKPIAGIGVGNFQTSSIHYQIRPGAAAVRTDLADNPSVAHNSYLEIWAELGHRRSGAVPGNRDRRARRGDQGQPAVPSATGARTSRSSPAG